MTAGRSPEAGRESVDGASLALERVWLALRTRAGISTPTEGSNEETTVRRWLDDGLAFTDGSRLRLTPEGWLLLDALAVELTDGR